VLAAALLILPGCGQSSSYEPPTTTRDPQIEGTIASLEEAVNAKDPFAVCALYSFPAPNCAEVWRKRLARLAVPIDLPVAEIAMAVRVTRGQQSPRVQGPTPSTA
jgi:hypothetical protein